MALTIPTLDQLVARARAAFTGELPGVDAWTPFNNVGPTAKVIGHEMWPLFGKLRWVADQAVPWTATDRDWIKRHAAQVGLVERPAAPATGAVTVSADAALAIEAGALFTRDDGVVYETLAPAALAAAGSVDVAAAAKTEGVAGCAVAGRSLAAISGLSGPGVAGASAVVAAGGMVGGLDVESTDSLKARLLFRLRYTPQGGAATDYVSWCLAVPGVTRVFVERLWRGPGTLRVFPLFDDLRPGGAPVEADLDLVRRALEWVAPAAAGVTVAAATAQPIDVVISDLRDGSLETRSAVAAALAAAIRAKGRVAGADASLADLPFIAAPFSFSRSWLGEAISGAVGERRHVLASPGDDIVIAPGAAPALGALTFV